MIMGGLREGRLLTRLHPCSMHPCQLLLLALYSDTTRIINSSLGHELATLNDLLGGSPMAAVGCGPWMQAHLWWFTDKNLFFGAMFWKRMAWNS
jgi:hypothetical protein